MTDPTSAPPTQTGLSWPVIVLALLLVGALAGLAYTWTQAQQAAQQAVQQIDLTQATATAASLAQAEQSQATAAALQQAAADELAAAQSTAAAAQATSAAEATAQATSAAAEATAQANQEAALAAAAEEAGLQARQSAAYRLAAAALATLPTQPDQSLLLARDAVSASLAIDANIPPEISGALRQAIRANNLDERLTAGHTGSVNDAAFSPDGNRLATAGDDGTVRLWNTTSGGQLLVISTTTSQPFYSVAFSAGGDRLAAASFDQTAKIWDASTGEELLTLTGHKDWVVGVAFGPAPQGEGEALIATGSQDGTAILWNAATGKKLLSLTGHTAAVNRLTFSPAGDRLATASDDGTLMLWDTVSGKLLLTLSGHAGPVYDVAFDPAGERVASASIDGTVKIWDSETGQEERTLRHNRDDWATSVAFNASGEWLASAGNDGRIVVWDAATGRERLSLTGHADAINGLAVSPQVRAGEWLASAGADGQVRLWRLTGDEAVLGLPPLADHQGPVYGLAALSDSQLATADGDGLVKLWQLGPDQPSLTRTLDPAAGSVYAAALSPEGDLLAAAGETGQVVVWKTTFPDTAPGETETEFRLAGHTGPVYALAFNPAGGQLTSAGEDGSIRLWDTTSGEEVAALAPTEGGSDTANAPVYSLAFHASGAFLATAGQGGQIRLWDLASNEQIAGLPSTGATVRALAFHPALPDTPAADGAGALLVIGGDDGTVRLWTVRQSIRALPSAGAAIQALAFSPDQQRLAAVTADGTITIWSMVSGQIVERLASPAGVKAGYGLAFLDDGETLFSGGQIVSAAEPGGALLRWDAAADELLNLYTPAALAGLALNEGRVVAAGADGQVRLWKIEPGTGRWSAQPSGGRVAAQGVFTTTEPALLTSVAVAGDYLAAGDDAGTAWVWNLGESGRLRATLPTHTGPVNRVVLLSSTAGISESRLITAGQDDTAKVWMIASTGAVSRQPELTLAGHTGDVTALAVSPGPDALLATASHDGTARLWNLETGEEGLTLAGHSGWVNDVAFNPAGDWLTTAGEDGTVRVWEAASGKELLRLDSSAGLRGPVKRVAFSPTGEGLAALTGDGHVFAWSLTEAQSGDTLPAQLVLQVPSVSGSNPGSLAFDSTGRALVTAGADGVIRFYAWTVEDLLTLR